MTGGGQVRVACEFCGHVSEPVTPQGGRPRVWQLPGWSECPYPADYVHADGSLGSTWACPDCERRLGAGEALRSLAAPGR